MSFQGVIGDVVEIGRGDGTFSCEWKIPDFLSLAGETGNRYQSPHFDACGGRWCLKICLNGLWQDLPSDSVSLILIRSDSGLPKALDITLGIRGEEGVENIRERRQKFLKDDPACLWSKFCSRWKLTEQNSRLMPGNVLIISLDMKSVLPSVAIDSSTPKVEEAREAEASTEENHSSEKIDATTEKDDDLKEVLIDGKQFPGKKGVEALQKSLQSLLAGGEDSDVFIKVRGKEFPAHRAILRARSPVFRAMFAHDTVERQSGTVTMEDCDPETFPDFLEHVYTGSVEMISSTNVFNLYAASDKYDLSTLKEECADFMKRNLTVASFCNSIALAIQHGDQDLIERTTAFFCDNSLEIVETPEWQTFLQENSIVGNELFIKFIRHNQKK